MTKNIVNMENYEIFLMDYFDNNLSEESVAALMLFLDQHPEIKEEASGLFDFTLIPEDISFDKESLKKSDNMPPLQYSPDELFVAETEGDLNESKSEALRVILRSNKSFEKDRKLYHAIKFKPDFSETFGGKELLYHIATENNEPVSEENFDDYAVAYHEGDLSDKKITELKTFAENRPELKAALLTYSSLRFKPDESIVFDNKKSLKKRAGIIIPIGWKARVAISAAAVFLLLMLYPGLIDNTQNPTPVNTYRKTERTIVPKQHITIAKATENHKSKPETQRKSFKNKKTIAHTFDLAASSVKTPLVEIKIPEVKMQTVSTINYASYIFKTESGYYEVKLKRETFFDRNPTLKEKLIAGIRKILHVSPEEINAPKDKLTLWDVADAGLKGFGALTENDISLSRK